MTEKVKCFYKILSSFYKNKIFFKFKQNYTINIVSVTGKLFWKDQSGNVIRRNLPDNE